MEVKRAIVTGRVQKVGYRAATQKKALKLHIKGWVRNLPSGQVEVCYTGQGEDVAGFELWLGKGPLMAKVKSVSIKSVAVDFLDQPPPEDAYLLG